MTDARLRPYTGPFDEAAAAHILVRTGFGAPPHEVAAAARAGLEATLDRITAPPSGDAARRWQRLRDMGPRMARRRGAAGLRALWLRRMLETPAPLREHLTLFWHDHFATAASKVDDAVAMHAQNELLLDRGVGRFDDLLLAIARDPAMLVWLDNASSSRRHPNENFARELFELFSLGIGHFEEADVRAAARAFTGWHVDRGAFRFSPPDHDSGPKTVLGVSGDLGGEEVVRACTGRPECARFIASKLWRWFVDDDVDEPLATALGEAFTAVNRRVEPFLRCVFASRGFFAARGNLIRSPVQLVVGALRTLQARVDVFRLADDVAHMGEALFEPPSVAGWARGRSWINSVTLTARHNFAADVGDGEDGRLGCRAGVDADPVDLARALLRREPPASDLARVVAARSPEAVAGAALGLPEAQLM